MRVCANAMDALLRWKWKQYVDEQTLQKLERQAEDLVVLEAAVDAAYVAGDHELAEEFDARLVEENEAFESALEEIESEMGQDAKEVEDVGEHVAHYYAGYLVNLARKQAGKRVDMTLPEDEADLAYRIREVIKYHFPWDVDPAQAARLWKRLKRVGDVDLIAAASDVFEARMKLIERYGSSGSGR